MADNRNLAALTGNAAADEVTYSGDTAVVQLARIVAVTGAEGSKTVVENMPASLGQKAKADSFPVTLSADEDTVGVSGTVAITGDVSVFTAPGESVAVTAAALPLPTGAATEAELDAQTALLTTIDADTSRIPALGQAAMAASAPVVVASNQSAIPVSGTFWQATQPVSGTIAVTGVATETTLAAASAKLPATLGQKAMAASMAVVVASDQSAIPVSGTVAVTGVAADDADFTDGTTPGLPAMGVYESAPSMVTDGDLGVVGITVDRKLRVFDSDLVAPIDNIDSNTTDSAVSLALIGDTVATLGTTLYTEATTKGQIIGAVRRDADTTLVGTTNEIGPLQMDANGRLKVEAFSGETLPVSGTVTANAGSGTQAVSLAALPALVAGSANIGDVDVATIAAGDNNIGNVDIVTLPALVAGTANIGDVDIVTVPTDPFGANADSSSSAGGVGTMQAKLRLMTLQLAGIQTAVQLIDDAISGTEMQVDIVAAVPGTGATNLGKAVDSVGGSTDTGVAALGLREDALVTITPADGDYTRLKVDPLGKQWVNTGLSPELYVSKSFNATTTQTGIDVWDPAGGKKIAITSVVIGTYGTTAARVILWFGDNADTTYTAGTDQVLLAASFAPSATAKPGLVFTPSHPVFCNTADRELHITTDAGISLDIVVHGWEY